ncbi:Aste57867_8460 [Aphanomyces stellatus]|uniref:Aste57867_8460 protein n=1 Tax=Aphanomyces stellatus TaxID=120398 RepID=A0A485KKC7_9STRA|nr:hypothetical protein As57867_008428 [Aphanomyces stellatus]VFT85346.1 Aste57867_8460 [Aphanomyces stellatus]
MSKYSSVMKLSFPAQSSMALQTRVVQLSGPPARRPSLATLELQRLFHRPVRVLATFKHLISSIYFASMLYVYLITSPSDIRTVQVFAPITVGAVMGFLSLLHLYGLACVCLDRRCTRHRPTTKRPSVLVNTTTQLMLFHLLDVFCQSYQAYHNSHYLLDRGSAFGFVVVVALNCLATPWFLLSKHKLVQQSAVPFVESVFGFFLSTLFQCYVFLYPALLYTLRYQTLRYDNTFTTRLLLITRGVIVSSPLDLVTKIVIQVSSYVALRRLVTSVQGQTIQPISRSSALLSTSRLSQHFQLQFDQSRVRVAYALGSGLWAIVMLTTSIAANWFRHPCPDTCVLQVSPWWSPACQCNFVQINCALKRVLGDSIDDQLDPAVLGNTIYCLHVRRCALPHGIPMATLAPFPHLFSLHISFSNMTSWAPDPPPSPSADPVGFPPSLTTLSIRFSQLKTIPLILASVPANFAYLALEDADIRTIPDSFVHAWANVTSFWFVSLNLTEVPIALATRSTPLELLVFTGNHIRDVPMTWQPQMTRLRILDLSANALTNGPWHLAQSIMVLELSSNPIASIPTTVDSTWLTKRKIVLDDTPYCATTAPPSGACNPKCAPLCETTMIGNNRCDWPCYSPSCQMDGGDCDAFGFTYQPS